VTIESLLRAFIPSRVKARIRSWLDREAMKYKPPKMIWGFKDSTGTWRPRTRISDTVFFYHREKIEIDDNVFIWHYTILDGTGGIKIGEGTQIGAWVGIFTHSSHVAIRIYGNHYQEVPENEKKGYPIAPVRIGKFVFVGASSKILPGISIGDGALISAGAIVTKDVANFDVVSGNPAEVVGNTRDIDKKYLEDPLINEWYTEWQKI
jgi:acetyltransferase-like isoleucine patch superfamily enzyme